VTIDYQFNSCNLEKGFFKDGNKKDGLYLFLYYFTYATTIVENQKISLIQLEEKVQLGVAL